MSTCSHRQCNFKSIPGNEKCILHADIQDKNVDFFGEQLQQHIEKCIKENDGHVVLESIVFPEHIKFDPFSRIDSKVARLGNVTLTQCKLPNLMKFQGIKLNEFELINNCGKELNLRDLKLDYVKIVDNDFDRLTLETSNFGQLTFLTYTPTGINTPKMGKVFLILNEIEYCQISNQVFNSLHIALTNIKGNFAANNLRSNDILIRESSFYSFTIFDEIMADKYFIFSNCVILKPQLFTIRRSDLSRSGFKGTVVSEINFVDNKWRESGKGRIRIIDHRIADGSESYKLVEGPYGKVSLKECSETYMQLKTNFEKKGNYIDAGDFHYSEMEMRRLSVPSFIRPMSIYSIYKYLSGYGEEPGKAIVVFFLVLISLSFLHLFIGFEVRNSLVKYEIQLSSPISLPSIHDLILSIRLTFANFTLRNIVSPTLAPNIWNNILWIFETIFGPLQLGLIALALKRRLRR